MSERDDTPALGTRGEPASWRRASANGGVPLARPEYGDARWELEASGGGTRLTLWHKIDRRYISMGAAGWHISLDVLDRLLSGTPIGRIAGPDSMRFEGWQRLNAEYARQFGVEKP